jgi:hypothetical protein
MVQGVKMLILNYENKNALKECIGKPLNYEETSIFGAEYEDNGILTGCNRPHITGYKKEFFANVVMENGLIKEVK